ncbi:cytochrome oxidase assembly protein 1 [Sporothrix curviconia]|uniref:Cytochrome oxidase assembly protein 1 n=1 Tax=Sporothrix curviconia TaxID=1260050 RepID=A0ABP0APZ3_9PEZI
MLSSTAGRRAVAAGLLRPRQSLGLGLARIPRPALLLLSVSSPVSPLSQSLPSGHRTYVSAPRPGDGPLMERRADRELPDVVKSRFRWSRTLPWFLLIVAGCSVAIFNYQKSSSPVVASTLYALRTSPRARAYLGDEIYFQQRIPWIAGEMNQMRGRINIHFAVKGTRNTGRMRFTSHRPTPRGVFETIEWSLETSDGRKIDLLEDVTDDPFRGIQLLPDDYVDALEEDFNVVPPAGLHGSQGEHGSAVVSANVLEPVKETRGFRQPTKR